MSIAIAATVVRARARGRFFNLVDLVNQLKAEKAAGSGRLSEPSCAMISSLSTSSAIFPSAMPVVPPQSCLRQPQVFGDPKMTTAMLERITGNESWRFKNRLDPPWVKILASGMSRPLTGGASDGSRTPPREPGRRGSAAAGRA